MTEVKNYICDVCLAPYLKDVKVTAWITPPGDSAKKALEKMK